MVAEGLPLFHGAQLAIDTTMVSRRKQRRYTELAGEDGRARLVVFVCEVLRGMSTTFAATAGATRLALQFGSMLACSGVRARALSLLEQRSSHGVDGPVLWEACCIT